MVSDSKLLRGYSRNHKEGREPGHRGLRLFAYVLLTLGLIFLHGLSIVGLVVGYRELTSIPWAFTPENPYLTITGPAKTMVDSRLHLLHELML